MATPTPAEILASMDKNGGYSSSGKAMELVEAINNRVIEASQFTTNWSVPDRCISNMSLFLNGSNRGARVGKYYRMNQIQLVCIANAAIQAGDRPTIKVKPRESGEPSIGYFNPQVQLAPMVFQQLQQKTQIRPEALGGENQVPLTDTEVALLKDEIELSEARKLQSQAMGLPVPLDLVPPEILVEVNDHTEAEAAQMIFDIKSDQANFSRYVIENVLYNNIFGTQFLLCDWNDQEKRFYFRNVELVTVAIDPFRTDVRDCQYLVYDQFMEADEAKATYPDLSSAIEANATQGPPTMPGITPYRTPMPWYQAYMGRRVIIVRTAWLRNQPYPLTPQQAIEAGKIVALPEQIKHVESSGIGDEGFFSGLLKKFGMGGNATPTPNPDQNSESKDGDVPDVQAGQSEQNLEPESVDGMAFYLVNKDGLPDMETGEITETHPKWPVRRAIRQVQIIANTLVSDMECERVDIPLGHNVNIPIPYTPFGQGEPERLEPLQDAYNNCLTDIINHGDYAANPAKLVLASVAKANPNLVKNAFTSPGTMITVDDKAAAQANGLDKSVVAIQAPNLPTDSWQRLNTLQGCFDRESDQSQILRGSLPGQSSMSGQAIGQLQGAAKSSITFKSGRTEDMLTYLARVMLGDIILRMSVDDLSQCVRKFPPAAWKELHRRLVGDSNKGLSGGYLECDLSVSVQGGGGAANMAETQSMVATAGGAIPWSPQTLIERMGGDPQIEMQQSAEWARKQAKMQQQQGLQGVAAQPPAGVPQPQQSDVMTHQQPTGAPVETG